jgi:hypothetical protein
VIVLALVMALAAVPAGAFALLVGRPLALLAVPFFVCMSLAIVSGE